MPLYNEDENRRLVAGLLAQAQPEVNMGVLGRRPAPQMPMQQPMQRPQMPQQAPQMGGPAPQQATFGDFFGVGPQAQQMHQQGMSDPRGAAWGQALHNIAQMNMGGIPSQSPFGAANDVRAQNALLMQTRAQQIQQEQYRSQQMQYQDMQQRIAMARLGQAGAPKIQSLGGLGYGVVNPDGSYQVIPGSQPASAAGGDGPASLQEMAWLQDPARTDADRELYFQNKRSGSTFSSGGGGVSYRGPNGELIQLVTPGDATKADAKAQGASASAANWANYDDAFAQSFPAQQEGLKNIFGFTGQMLSEFQGKDLAAQSGLIQGRYGPLIDETAAYIDTMSTMVKVPLLREAGLNPVTEQEFATIKSTLADFKRDPAANTGALKAQMDYLRPKLAELERQSRHFNQYGTLRGYAQTRAGAFPDYSVKDNQSRGTVDLDGLPED